MFESPVRRSSSVGDNRPAAGPAPVPQSLGKWSVPLELLSQGQPLYAFPLMKRTLTRLTSRLDCKTGIVPSIIFLCARS